MAGGPVLKKFGGKTPVPAPVLCFSTYEYSAVTSTLQSQVLCMTECYEYSAVKSTLQGGVLRVLCSYKYSA